MSTPYCFLGSRLCSAVLLTLLVTSILAGTSYFATEAKGLGQLSTTTNFFDGPKDDGAYSIVRTSDGGFAIAGYTESYGAGGSDMWLIRTFQRLWGTSCYYQVYGWNNTYGGAGTDVAKSVIQTSDGGFALAGYTNSSGAGGFDMYLVKTDAYGNAQWSMTYGGQLDDGANSLIQTVDGGYLMAGYTGASNGTGGSTWLVKTDASGNMEWNQTYSGNSANDVVQASDGGYVLAVDYPSAFGLIKTDSSGQVLFNQTYPSEEAAACTTAVIQTSDGGYALAGWTGDSQQGPHDTWLIKTDSAGNELWDKTIAGAGAYALIQTLEGGYALAGDYATLIVTDASGNVLWNQVYDMLSSDMRAHVFTATYCLVEYGPLEFALAGTQQNYGMDENGYGALFCQIQLKSDTTPPAIQVLTPESGQSYASGASIPLTFYVNTTAIYLWYSLDGFNYTTSGNTTLPNLSDGEHFLTVYATDSSYNVGLSNPVTFDSQTIAFQVGSSAVVPSNQPIQNPSQTAPMGNSRTNQSKPDQMMPIYAAIAVVLIIVAAVLFLNRRNLTEAEHTKNAKTVV